MYLLSSVSYDSVTPAKQTFCSSFLNPGWTVDTAFLALVRLLSDQTDIYCIIRTLIKLFEVMFNETSELNEWLEFEFRNSLEDASDVLKL